MLTPNETRKAELLERVECPVCAREIARFALPAHVKACRKARAYETLAQEHMRRVHSDGSECQDGCDLPVIQPRNFKR